MWNFLILYLWISKVDEITEYKFEALNIASNINT